MKQEATSPHSRQFSFTLHSSPFTLHPSLFTLHSSPFTLHPSRSLKLHLPFQDNIAAAVYVLHQKEQSIAVVGSGDLLL